MFIITLEIVYEYFEQKMIIITLALEIFNEPDNQVFKMGFKMKLSPTLLNPHNTTPAGSSKGRQGNNWENVRLGWTMGFLGWSFIVSDFPPCFVVNLEVSIHHTQAGAKRFRGQSAPCRWQFEPPGKTETTDGIGFPIAVQILCFSSKKVSKYKNKIGTNFFRHIYFHNYTPCMACFRSLKYTENSQLSTKHGLLLTIPESNTRGESLKKVRPVIRLKWIMILFGTKHIWKYLVFQIYCDP